MVFRTWWTIVTLHSGPWLEHCKKMRAWLGPPIPQAAWGQPPKTESSDTVQIQARLLQLCQDHQCGVRIVQETQSRLAHNIYGILVLARSQRKTYSVSNYIEESFFNAMEGGHHTAMNFFPIWCMMKRSVYCTVNGRRFSNTNAPLMAADSQILIHR